MSYIVNRYLADQLPYTQTNTHTHTHRDTHTHTHTHTHTTHTHTHTHNYTHTEIHTHTVAHIQSHIYSYRHKYTQYIQLHTHSYTNTHTHTRSHIYTYTYYTHIDLAHSNYVFRICVYCARSSTPSTHVLSQYTTLPPLMLPVLSRQEPRQQSAQRHHSCQSGQHGHTGIFVRAIV